MTPIAAYYVMVATDVANEAGKPRYDSIVPKVSVATRLVRALESLARLGRPAVAQTA